MSIKKPPKPTGSVLNFGLARIKKGRTPRPRHGVCRHINQTYDPVERRVWCDDCGDEIEVFDAYLALVEQTERAARNIDDRMAEVEEAEQNTLISRASKAIDKCWRRRDAVPLCPHCSEGIFPEDVLVGLKTSSKKWLQQKRNSENKLL